ncbi:hypothetical protein [Pseudomonas sp. NPDC086251]|uniref:hypothetical protein n=1 Tax=Pseudomonas sp. NPDC086251 TaxID=3364431 RepID=UPI003839BD79
MADQIPHLDLHKDIGALNRRVVLATKSVFVEEAGLFGAELEFGDGERIVFPFQQGAVQVIHTSKFGIQREYNGAAIVILQLDKTLTIQPSGIFLADAVHKGVMQAAVGFSISVLVNQSKARPVPPQRTSQHFIAETRDISLLKCHV